MNNEIIVLIVAQQRKAQNQAHCQNLPDLKKTNKQKKNPQYL